MSYETALQELISQGIVPTTVEEFKENNDIVEPLTQQILDTLESVNENKFSKEQKKILKHTGNMCIIACAGSGKALINGTGVLTENGYKPIEELKVHDKVFNDIGNLELVLGVFPQGKKRVYALTMNDGHLIKCCEDHLWTIKQCEIFNTNDGEKDLVNYYKTVTTKELYEKYRDKEIKIPTVNIEKSQHEYRIYDRIFKHTKEEIVKFLVRDKLSNYSDTIEGFGNLIHWTSLELLLTINREFDGKNSIIRIRNQEFVEDLRLALEISGYHCRIEVKTDELDRYFEFTVLSHLESSIVCVEKTNEFEEMTCIKVSGKTELFLTEHCYVTHNTTILTNLIAKRIATGEIKDVNKVVCTTYSKGGATEMEERLHLLLNKLGYNYKIKVVTLHAFFLNIIRAFGINMAIISEGERLKFIAESAKEAGVDLRDDDLMNLSNLISFQLNNLMVDKKALESEANTLNNLTLENYAKIRNGYAIKKYQKQKMDFDDMQLYLYKWIVKDKTSDNQVERESAVRVRNYCKALYNNFYIDEAQDLSKIQFAIIREMLADPNNKNKLDKNLVFVGDDSQCIYKWRGADPSIILNIGNTFDIDILMLSTNYRCRENIVNFAANSILHTSVIYPKEMKAFNKGGNIKIAVAEPKKDDILRLSKIAFNHIKTLLDNGESPNDICVMSRNNFHLALLSNMLLREGIYTSATNEMKLTNSTLYKDLKLILDCCEDNYDVSITRQVLFKIIRYMSAANSKVIADVQDSAGLTLRQTLGYMLKTFQYMEVNEEREIKVPRKAEDAIRLKWDKFSNETIRNLVVLYRILCEKDHYKKLVGLYTMYIETAGELFYKREDKNRSLKGLCNYMALMVQENGYENTKDFLRITEQLEQGDMAINGDKITLTTVHSAKGKEWKNVIAFAVDNISMPSVESLKDMVKNNATINEINEYIDEERRLYYVEITRAKEDLLIITSSTPSLFLMESLNGLNLAEGETSNMVMLDAICGDSYVSQNQYEKLFNRSVISEKLLNKESSYYYKIQEN